MGARRRASQNGKRGKRYEHARPGSSTGPVLQPGERLRQRWRAPGPDGSLHRTRKDALRACPAGMLPELVRFT